MSIRTALIDDLAWAAVRSMQGVLLHWIEPEPISPGLQLLETPEGLEIGRPVDLYNLPPDPQRVAVIPIEAAIGEAPLDLALSTREYALAAGRRAVELLIEQADRR